MAIQQNIIEAELNNLLYVIEKACDRFQVEDTPQKDEFVKKAEASVSKNKMQKVNVTAPLHTEAAALSRAADALMLPPEEERQPDLQYLSAIFVSSGMNKNGAVFLGSELVKARDSIGDKAVDVEHDERSVIGQITGSIFLEKDRTPIDVERAASLMTAEQLDELEMDIGITAIVHQSRFPEIAEEIEQGEWMVSMEAFYRDYDVKIGDMIIPKDKAEALGFDKLVGSVVKLKDGNKEKGFHLVGRVLRDIIFSGVGIVKNPANPRSMILESAAMNKYIQEKAEEGENKEIDLQDLRKLLSEEASGEEKEQSITKDFIREVVNQAVEEAITNKSTTEKSDNDPQDNEYQNDNQEKNDLEKEEADAYNHILPGTCVHYRRYVYDRPEDSLEDPETDLTQYPLYTQPGPAGVEYPGSEVAREHYCNLFDLDCTARPGDATSPNCWRNVFARTTREEINTHEEVLRRRRIQEGLVELQRLIDKNRSFER